jgi:hypothetical protein
MFCQLGPVYILGTGPNTGLLRRPVIKVTFLVGGKKSDPFFWGGIRSLLSYLDKTYGKVLLSRPVTWGLPWGARSPRSKTIIGEASLGSFIRVLVRTPPLIVSGIRFGGVTTPPLKQIP